MTNYQRVAKAIAYIKEYATDQPNLDDIASAVHLSSYHFHRMFKVWEALLKIPAGQLATYSYVAQEIDNPKASRAVGTALAQNPLIPCHRVIKKVGGIGEYRWGSTRKTAIIGWEAAQKSGGNHVQTD